MYGGGLNPLHAGFEGSIAVEGMDSILLCLLSVVFIAASATNGSLDQRIPAECVRLTV